MGKNVPAVMTVEQSVLIRGASQTDSSESAEIEVREFTTAHAMVSVMAERTVNLGNYNSLKMGIRVDVPCYVEEVAGVQKELARRVPARVDKLVEQYLETNGKTAVD